MRNDFLKNVIYLYKYETLSQTKKNFLPLFVSGVIIVFGVYNLLMFNFVINFAMRNNQLNFDSINNYFKSNIILIFILIIVFTPFFLSKCINSLINNNVIFNFISLGINIEEIVVAEFIRGFFNVSIILLSTFPIIYLSMLFNIYYILNFLKYIILFYSFINIISGICIYMSMIVKNETLSLVYSYIIGILLLFINILFVINFNVNFVIILCYLTISIIFSIFLFRKIKHIDLC